ncbi:MAG: hypothetical protein D4R40_01765 [Nitrosomonadaceae bacterium]|nr:MAG: hypothetical protein D4R40_01765 [Nitrosomonadaceae bacterium]
MNRISFRTLISACIAGLGLFGIFGCAPFPPTTPLASGTVTGIAFEGLIQPPNEFCDSNDPVKLAACTPELKNAIQFAPLTQRINFVIQGSGTCEKAILGFGDGNTLALLNVSSWPFRDNHTYFGWGGLKHIRVLGQVNCLGDVKSSLNVGHAPSGSPTFVLAFAPNLSVCNRVPNVSPVRAGSVLRIKANGTKIKYGIPEFDASGDRSVAAPTTFAFPSMRPFSLVYRIGTDVFQGEVGPVVVRATQTAPLEICVNDHPAQLSDNRSQGVRIDIDIAEAASIP